MSHKILTALSLIALLVATANSQSPPATPAKSIVVEDGLVTLIYDNKVPASNAGMLTNVVVSEGQTVDKGTLLAEIDNRETHAKKRIAEGELKAALTTSQSNAEVEVAEKAVLVAEQELEAINSIRKANPNAVPMTEVRKNQFQLDRAIAQVKQAKVEKIVAGQTAEVKQAQLESTDIELDLRQLKAPFKGQIVEVIKRAGDWCQPGDTVIHIMGLDRLRVKGFVLASQAAPVEVIGKPAVITVYGAGNKQHTLKGIVGFASPQIEGVSASRQYRIWVDVDNEKVIDPVTKIESWKIEPGTPANMTIDLTPPPPPKPVAPPKAAPGKGGVPAPPAKGAKVEAFKPAVGVEPKSKDR